MSSLDIQVKLQKSLLKDSYEIGSLSEGSVKWKKINVRIVMELDI